MNNPKCSRHAAVRARQRGLKEDDFSLIMRFGTETKDGYLLRRKDVAEVERKVKRFVSCLHRLEGKYVVADGDTVITTFHATSRQQHRLLQQLR